MSYQNGDYGDAAASFERAARYADEFSQHYLSLMHWHGVGMEPDPVQGYIWADQAAERGSPRLLAIREKMWSQLTAQQQAEAADHGVDDYEGYGDMVAKPRAEAETRRFMRGITGSRIDYRNQRIDIQQGGPVHGSFGNARPGMFSATAMVVGTTSSEAFYADNRIDIAQYWQAQIARSMVAASKWDRWRWIAAAENPDRGGG
jgi:TPR repeat protein